MMKYMMIFMAFMFYKVPSGLGLYFITSSSWQICERLLLPKVLPAQAKPLVEGDDFGGDRGKGGAGPTASDPRGPAGVPRAGSAVDSKSFSKTPPRTRPFGTPTARPSGTVGLANGTGIATATGPGRSPANVDDLGPHSGLNGARIMEPETARIIVIAATAVGALAWMLGLVTVQKASRERLESARLATERFEIDREFPPGTIVGESEVDGVPEELSSKLAGLLVGGGDESSRPDQDS